MHPDGELATARGAGRAGTTLVVSTSATTTIEDVARAATAPLWFQLYMQPERDFTADLVRRAEAAGCRALCVTVDSPVAGPQNRIQRARFVLPAGIEAPMNPLANRQRRSTSTAGGGVEPFRIRYPATWADISWLKSLTRLPILLKGILHPADAEMAVSAGVDGIIVSNHGARNLDTAPATIEVLPEIAERVAGRIPVLMDGGIRRGTDVLKALALGADATLVGRAYLYGLAAAGAEGRHEGRGDSEDRAGDGHGPDGLCHDRGHWPIARLRAAGSLLQTVAFARAAPALFHRRFGAHDGK